MENIEVDPSLQGPSTSGITGFGSDDRLVDIFEKEIDKEIAERIADISEIGENITKCKEHLDRLRKEALSKYSMDNQQDLENGEQSSLHPAVKKLIGKRPPNVSQTEEFMASNLAERKRETRKKLPMKCSTKKIKHSQKLKGEKSTNNVTLIRPCYIPPNIPGNPQENSSLRGNSKKMHMRVLVGNVAKQIQSDGELFDPATHKWMAYVRSAPGSLAVDHEVACVQFYLHPSYKPHDIVTIPNPPFTLNRKGWGEFPLRVQLHFKNHLNKPADIIHHLQLNGARSGHHTRSAETFADLWLYPHKPGQEKKADEKHSDSSPTDYVEKISKCSFPNRKQVGQLKNKNVFGKGSDVIGTKVNKEAGFDGFNVASNIYKFAKLERDILDVDVSAIMDALEMKQEEKEPKEMLKKCNENIEAKEHKDNHVILKDGSKLLLEEDYLSKNQEQPMNVDSDQVENKIICHSNNAMNLSQMTNPTQVTPVFLPTNSHSGNSFLDSNMIIEEELIDEFLNSLLEEETVMETPKMSVEDKRVNESEVTTKIPGTQEILYQPYNIY